MHTRGRPCPDECPHGAVAVLGLLIVATLIAPATAWTARSMVAITD